MNIIVATDLKDGIGREGKLLYRITEDMKRFRELTLGKKIIMGRKTLESLPNGEPLDGRENFVLSRNKEFKKSGCTIVHSVNDITDGSLRHLISDDTFVIGGGEIYRRLIPYCNKIYMTQIKDDGKADVFFPNISSKDWMWSESESSHVFTDKKTDLRYQFHVYYRR